MKVDIQRFETNVTLGELVKEKLAIPENVRVDLFASALLALNDITRGIADLHPHKRSVATLGALPSPLREVARGFAKQGYIVQEIPCDVQKKQEEQKAALVTAVDNLKKDTLFVLGCESEPFTGVLYPWALISDEIHKKNIFTLNYFGPASLATGMKIPTHALEAFVLDPCWGEASPLSFALKGERCMGEPLLWGEDVFNREAVIGACEKTTAAVRFGYHPENTVLKFEKEIKGKLGDRVGILPFYCHRLYDRSVIFLPGVNGDAAVHALKSRGVQASTADACYWGDPHLNTWLPKLGFSVDDAQTLITLPLKEIEDNPKIIEIVTETASEIQRKSAPL